MDRVKLSTVPEPPCGIPHSYVAHCRVRLASFCVFATTMPVIRSDTSLPLPFELSSVAVEELVASTTDWQIANGMLLKYRNGESVQAVPVGVSLYPIVLPNSLFQHALRLQVTYNKLYAAIACDEDFLWQTLQKYISREHCLLSYRPN